MGKITHCSVLDEKGRGGLYVNRFHEKGSRNLYIAGADSHICAKNLAGLAYLDTKMKLDGQLHEQNLYVSDDRSTAFSQKIDDWLDRFDKGSRLLVRWTDTCGTRIDLAFDISGSLDSAIMGEGQ